MYAEIGATVCGCKQFYQDLPLFSGELRSYSTAPPQVPGSVMGVQQCVFHLAYTDGVVNIDSYPHLTLHLPVGFK